MKMLDLQRYAENPSFIKKIGDNVVFWLRKVINSINFLQARDAQVPFGEKPQIK